jgi:glutathione synthase/RimK-type ligase-like ATP-grasp enzyme
LATCRKVADADPDLGSEIDKDIDGDMQITLDALTAVGIDARAVAWDDASFDWSSADAVIVRSTWDYHRHVDAFLNWVDTVGEQTRLENAPDVLRWNIDKRYLAEIENAGLPVIETLFIEPHPSTDHLSNDVVANIETLAARGDLVVKPAISAGSNDTQRHGTAESALEHIASLVARGRVVMVQPYLEHVDIEAETGLVYIDGEFSHAFSKGPMLAAPGNAVGDLYLAETIDARTPTPAQRDLGDRVMAMLNERWGRLLYARIDMLPTEAGPVIIEVELTEPSLYLHLDVGAPARFATAIARRLDGLTAVTSQL